MVTDAEHRVWLDSSLGVLLMSGLYHGGSFPEPPLPEPPEPLGAGVVAGVEGHGTLGGTGALKLGWRRRR